MFCRQTSLIKFKHTKKAGLKELKTISYVQIPWGNRPKKVFSVFGFPRKNSVQSEQRKLKHIQKKTGLKKLKTSVRKVDLCFSENYCHGYSSERLNNIVNRTEIWFISLSTSVNSIIACIYY